MIEKYLTYLGIIKRDLKKEAEEIYKPVVNVDTAKAYLRYLEGLFEYQRNRQDTIESKNSQLLGQASIVISIVALFIPLFSEKFEGINTIIKYTAVVIFLLAVFHYFLTILNAGKVLDIYKYPYSVGRTRTITKDTRNEGELEFLNQQIDDLVFSVNHNNLQNDKKGDCLIRAGYFFKIANIIFLFLTIILLAAVSTKKSTMTEVKISNASEFCCSDNKIPNLAPPQFSVLTQINAKLEFQQVQIDSINFRLQLILMEIRKPCVPLPPRKPRIKKPCP